MMMGTGEHFIERCECGLVVRQCRCPSPGKVETIVTPCHHSDAEKRMGRQDHPPVGWHWHGTGMARIQHENHPDMNEGAHIHPGDMPPETPWFGNPEEMGLTDDPDVGGEEFAVGPFSLPGVMALSQHQMACIQATVYFSDGMADIVAMMIDRLANAQRDEVALPEDVVGLIPHLSMYLSAYWRARTGRHTHPVEVLSDPTPAAVELQHGQPDEPAEP